jgi:flagellin-like hook-associated protein FlgL
MRIAGNTLRRNYLSRYEKNYSDKYNSEKKIYSGRQFDRASENPINAARALRIRKSIAEVETYQDNLKSADSIYTNAETAMRTVSGIIQSVYEKLVEGAHGTRNDNDLEIIAKEIDNYAEEMVQSLNIDIADRKIFGGLNNDTVAFKVEGSGENKHITYNGVAINSSNDPESFPFSGTSYLDIGIGMATDGNINRIDDQTALPVTFNGAECTGCGMTSKTAAIDLSHLIIGKTYKISVTVGGKQRDVEFTADTADKNMGIINEALKEKFKSAPEINPDGTYNLISDPVTYPYGKIEATDNRIAAADIEDGKYYSIIVKTENKERTIDFLGDSTQPLANLQKALEKEFGEGISAVSDGTNISIYFNNNKAAIKTVLADQEIEETPMSGGQVDLAALTPGKTYAINLGGKKVNDNGETVPVDGQKIYFTAGDTPEETAENINNYIINNEVFGTPLYPQVSSTGTFMYGDPDKNIIVENSPDAAYDADITSIDGYAKNIMQLVLDSAKMLRKGDQQLVARYADLIYAAQSNLSIAIADLGTHSKFIEFNEDRLSEVQINLNSKQNDVESTDLPSEITNWKVLESIYNASLQMGSSVLSQTIFNYIK